MNAQTQPFFWKFLRNPARTGALAAATPQLARRVAQATHQAYWQQPVADASGCELPLIELGAGTGALTHYISAFNPLLVESDPGWAALLKRRFPLLEVRSGCAVETLANLTSPVGVVSSIPLLNNPQAGAIKAMLEQRYLDGLVRFCVLYTYGWNDPMAGRAFRHSKRCAFVAANLPPAFVWVYR